MVSGYGVIVCDKCQDGAVTYSDSEARAWYAMHECPGVDDD
jgi:hypothetical protein